MTRLALLFMLAATAHAIAETPTRPRILGLARASFHVTDLAASREFYEGYLGLPHGQSTTPGRWRIPLNQSQSIELVADPAVSTEDDRLEKVTFAVEDAERLRLYLAARGLDVPARVEAGTGGELLFTVRDPDGHCIEFAQPPAQNTLSLATPASVPVSTRLGHAGILVRDLAAAQRFYCDVLGFRESWRGGAGPWLSWVNLETPEGVEHIELMLYAEPVVRAVRLKKHHLCLETDNLAAALALLAARPRPAACAPPNTASVGLNGCWQINYFDPDGTRVELMEPHPASGMPAPSSSLPPPPSARRPD